MREVIPGHLYELDQLKSDGVTMLAYYMDPLLHEGQQQRGPSTQEVLRSCIARVKHLDQEKPAGENPGIIHHLQQAIILFELRALRIKLTQDPEVEALRTNGDGHTFTLVEDMQE